MNIGIVNWNYETNHGGLEKTVCDLMRHLARQGHTVHLFYNKLAGMKRKQENMGFCRWTF